MKNIYFSIGALLIFNFISAQNVGIGTNTPDKAKLVVRGRVASTCAIFGDNSTGVALENDYPGIAFNTYFNNGRKSIADGYGGVFGLNPYNGDLYLYSSAVSGTADNDIPVNLRMVFSKDGNAGLQGVATPISPLSFASNTGNKIALWGTDAAANYGMGIQANLLQQFTSWYGADIAFGYGSSTNFTETMRIKGTGNVGIGTSTPDKAQLVVRGGVGGVNAMFGDNTTGVAIESNNPAIAFNSYFNGVRKSIANGYGGVVGLNPNNGDFYINSSDNTGTAGNALSTTTRMIIRSNGNIGIGNISVPVAKLEVAQNGFNVMQLTNTNTLSAGQNIDLTFRTGNYYTGGIHTIGTSATTARLALSTGNFLTERLSITSDGKVGINNSNPTAKLEVNGKTIINSDPGDPTALEVKGRIKLTGSILDYSLTASDLLDNGVRAKIDHPYINGNSSLMLIVNSVGGAEDGTFSIQYDYSISKWTLARHQSAVKILTHYANITYKTCADNCTSIAIPQFDNNLKTFSTGESFTILVIER